MAVREPVRKAESGGDPEAARAIREYLPYNSEERLHSSPVYIRPVEFEEQLAARKHATWLSAQPEAPQSIAPRAWQSTLLRIVERMPHRQRCNPQFVGVLRRILDFIMVQNALVP